MLGHNPHMFGHTGFETSTGYHSQMQNTATCLRASRTLEPCVTQSLGTWPVEGIEKEATGAMGSSHVFAAPQACTTCRLQGFLRYSVLWSSSVKPEQGNTSTGRMV